jgi:hypothetical protein
MGLKTNLLTKNKGLPTDLKAFYEYRRMGKHIKTNYTV